MNFPSVNTQSNCQKPMSVDQFNQVVEAISEGRYSWACVLILRYAGYNPVHFIPYRTYSRLIKEDNQRLNESRAKQEQIPSYSNRRPSEVEPFGKIRDLGYLETVDRQEKTLKGGSLFTFFDSKFKQLSLRSLNLN